MPPTTQFGNSGGKFLSSYNPSGSTSGKKKSKPQSKTKKAGILFPVGRIGRHLKSGRYAKRMGAGAPIFMAAVLEYTVGEVLELASKFAAEQNKTRITPRHVQLAIRSDEELNQLLGNVIIASGGVYPTYEYLVQPHTPNKSKPKKKAKTEEASTAGTYRNDDAEGDEDEDSGDVPSDPMGQDY